MGGALDESTLSAVMGADEQVQATLHEALAEQVLIADEDERFCFRHALLREALYDDLLPGERGEWLRRGEALDGKGSWAARSASSIARR